jgi:hypothetical protein
MTDWIFQGNGQQLDRGSQGSTCPMPADVAAILGERASGRLDPI